MLISHSFFITNLELDLTTSGGRNGTHWRCLSATKALVNETCRQVKIVEKPKENTHFLRFQTARSHLKSNHKDLIFCNRKQARFRSQLDSIFGLIGVRLGARRGTEIETNLDAKMDPKIDAKLDRKMGRAAVLRRPCNAYWHRQLGQLARQCRI